MPLPPGIRFSEQPIEDAIGPLNEFEKKNAPPLLYLAGDPDLLRRTVRVSVVGSRRASPAGRQRASRLVRSLVERAVSVVSGLAEGIDTAAHETAIGQGGTTIAVLGTPLDQFYPARNRELQLRIMREHLAVSQFPPGFQAGRTAFPRRNRTMALLSDAIVIVEAGESSGTLHQGWEALRLNRPLFIMRSVVEDPALRWPGEMLRYGATSLHDVEQVLESVPPSPALLPADLAF